MAKNRKRKAEKEIKRKDEDMKYELRTLSKEGSKARKTGSKSKDADDAEETEKSIDATTPMELDVASSIPDEAKLVPNEDDAKGNEAVDCANESINGCHALNEEIIKERIRKWGKRIGKRNLKSSLENRRFMQAYSVLGYDAIFLLTHTAPAKYQQQNTNASSLKALKQDRVDNPNHMGKEFHPESDYKYTRSGDNYQTSQLKYKGKKVCVIYRPLYVYFLMYREKCLNDFKPLTDDKIHYKASYIRHPRSHDSLFGCDFNSYSKAQIFPPEIKNYIESKLKEKYTGKLKKLKEASKYFKTSLLQDGIIDTIIELSNVSNNTNDYLSKLLTHIRQVVSQFNDIFGNGFKFNGLKWKPVSFKQGEDFYTYPCIIIQPEDFNNIASIKEYEKIMELFNKSSKKFKMFPRQSFGFLYPAINEVEYAVRIWPGLVPVDELFKIFKQIFTTEASSVEEKNDFKVADGTQGDCLGNNISTITLNKVVLYIHRLCEEFKNNSCKDKEKEKLWLHNRIVSNIIKARIILSGKFEIKDPIDKYLEITQIIENLNEYGLLLLQYIKSSIKIETKDIIKRLQETIGSYIKQGQYELKDAALTHSGFQAGMLALLACENKKLITGPCYYEFLNGDTLNKKQIKVTINEDGTPKQDCKDASKRLKKPKKDVVIEKKEFDKTQQTNNVPIGNGAAIAPFEFDLVAHIDPAYNIRSNMEKLAIIECKKSAEQHEADAKHANDANGAIDWWLDKGDKERWKEYYENRDKCAVHIFDVTNVCPEEYTKILLFCKSQHVYFYSSLSKHFQLGMDKFTFGVVMRMERVSTDMKTVTCNIPPKSITNDLGASEPSASLSSASLSSASLSSPSLSSPSSSSPSSSSVSSSSVSEMLPGVYMPEELKRYFLLMQDVLFSGKTQPASGHSDTGEKEEKVAEPKDVFADLYRMVAELKKTSKLLANTK